ncbi:MAG TPA: hypothetical protein ENO14_03325, partial [Chromatiales bacterium]|nr:hypothetical protein [Chromatiales bacterium]
MFIYLIPLLTTLTLLTAAAAMYQYRLRSRRVAERLHRVVDENATAVENNPLAEPMLPWPMRPLVFLGWIMPGLIFSETLKWDLARAGFRHLHARHAFAGARVLCAVGTGLGAFLSASLFRLTATEITVFMLLGGVVGFYLPIIYLRMRQSRRQLEITLALPDALDLLVICVEAGQGLNAALLKVSGECRFQSQALSDELRAANNEMLTGITRPEALR